MRTRRMRSIALWRNTTLSLFMSPTSSTTSSTTSTAQRLLRPVYEPSSKFCLKNGNQVATRKTSKSGFSLKDKKSKFLLKSDLRSSSTNFKPSMEIDHTITGCDQSRRDQLLLQEELSQQNRALRETRIKSLHEMEELKRVQELRVDEFSRRRLIENQDTVNERTARIQKLQNEVNCMNDSRDFEDAESVRSGPSHVPSQPALFPPYRDPGGLLSRTNHLPDIWNSQGTSGNVFANPRASSWSPFQEKFNPWISNVTEDTSPHVTSERQNPDTTLDARQDRQSEIHSTQRREDSQRIMEQTNKDCRSRNFTLTNSLHQQQLLVGR